MRRVTLTLLGTILVLGLACNAEVERSPTSPDPTAPRSDMAESSGPNMLWGLWQVAIDTTTGDIDVLPLRHGMFHANVVSFLQLPYPNGIGIQIDSMDLSTGLFDLVVRLTHPFSDPTYTGFDVKGIFISEPSVASKIDPSLRYAGFTKARLLQADGWSRWWNQPEFPVPGVLGYTEGLLGTKGFFFNSTLNPYKYFADELGPDDPFVLDSANRGCFTPAKRTNSRRYLIRFALESGKPVIVFNYAVDACWEKPTGDPGDISNFPPEANMPEAYQVSVSDTGSTAYYNPGTGAFGGDLRMLCDVCDWEIDSLSTATAELSHLSLESDTLFPGEVTLNVDDAVLQYGNCVRFDIDIPDVHPTSTENQEILFHAYAADGTYNQGLGAPAPDRPLAAYHLYDVPILDSIPFAQIPTGLTVDINRDGDGKLTGFTLDWDDTPGASEYMVYMSPDPYEIIGPVDMQPTPDSPVPDSDYTYNVTGAEVSGQWFAYVTARAVSGDPSTESGPSTWALVDFAAFEPYDEGDNEWRRRYNVLRNRFIAAVTSGYGVAGSGAAVLSPTSYFWGRAICYIVTPTLPAVPGAQQCYIEYAHKRAYDFPDGYGYSVCTSPIIEAPAQIDRYFRQGESNPQMQVTDYNVDLVDGTLAYNSGDVMNTDDILGLAQRFNDPDTESGDPYDGWSGTTSSGFLVSRYWLDKVIDDNHLYAGVCFGALEESGGHLISPYTYPLICDEMAVAIY